MAGPRFLLSAGEPSGDLHGAALARALRRRWPDASLFGLGGPMMADAGVELIAHVDDLAVMGFAEVLSRLPFFARLLREVRARLATERPDLVIPIDYPGFNLRLAQAAHRLRRPVLYYIAPQVWAWHRSRIRKFAACTDRIAVILPFEAPLFEEGGAHAIFVGHPLLDIEPERRERRVVCAEIGADPARPLLALFPGSRRQEVSRHLDLFEQAAGRVVDADPAVQPVIARSDAVPTAAYARSRWPRTPAGWELLQHADAAIVKSGTTTLQAALAGTPMVIAYRMHAASYALARRLVRVEHIGLANLVAGDRVAPELVQDEATPPALAAAVMPLLDRASAERRRMVERLVDVRRRLTAREAGCVADRVASLAAELLGAA